MKQALFFIWQLPQNLLGLLAVCILRAQEEGGIWWTHKSIGVCLGDYIIVNDKSHLNVIKHETGHQMQSFYLGPLYLLVIGIPSLLFCNLWDRLFHRKWSSEARSRWYYSRYPENWADKLGGVSR